MGKEQLDNQLITIDKAKHIIKQVVQSMDLEIISLTESAGRFLGEDVFSNVFIPPFNRSAMDGFACQASDLPGPLKMIGSIAAGNHSPIIIRPGECARIMTGAPVPEGADTVIMLEHTEEKDGQIRFVKENTKPNISPKGEDLKPGDLLVAKGTLLKSTHIAVLASSGIDHVKVYVQPSVGIIATGSELVEPGNQLTDGKIYNSNGHQLKARMDELRIDSVNYGVSKDDYQALKTSILKSIEQHNLLVITGGVSVGDYDFIPSIVEEIGFKIHFSKISAKPGKHTLFASKDGKYILGLPGNPVSTFIQFEECGQWILHAMSRQSFEPLRIEVELNYNHRRKRSDRFELLPVRIDLNGKVKSMDYHGSAHMHALAQANALMEIPIGVNELKEGDRVYVRPL